MKKELIRIELISRFMRYWLNEGFKIRSVLVFFRKDLRTKEQKEIINSCRNTREALTRLEATK